jgi:hypothetical protein
MYLFSNLILLMVMVFYGNANDETHSREKRLFEGMMILLEIHPMFW